MVERHGALYAAEYGWDGRFEALVARIAADFLDGHDPAREAVLIAEAEGARLGSVMVVRGEAAEVAKLRLLLVEPAARGRALGRTLVRAAQDFARGAGYARMALWTNDCLAAARALYAAEGWRPTGSAPHHSFGVALVGETWERAL